MPDYVKSEILEKISSHELTLLSLDTCIFHENGYNLVSGRLGNLSQLTMSHIDIVLSDIVIQETLAHMTSKISIPDAALKKAIKNFGSARKIEPHEVNDSVEKIINESGTPEKIAKLEIDDFMQRTSIAEVKSEDFVLVKDIISDYFRKIAPFSNERQKKHEFPDAFALRSLEAYAEQEGKLMLVVSNDNGWVDYCKKSKWLVCERALDDAVRHFQHIPSNAAPILYQRLRRGELPQLKSSIENEVVEYVETSVPHISAETSYAFDYDIEEVTSEILDYGIQNEFRLIYYNEETRRYVFIATINVGIAISVSFDFWSIIDGDNILRGNSFALENFPREASVIIEVFGDLSDNINIVEIQVVLLNTDFDFGYQEPRD